MNAAIVRLGGGDDDGSGGGGGSDDDSSSVVIPSLRPADYGYTLHTHTGKRHAVSQTQ